MLETLFRHLDMVRLSASAAMLMAIAGCTGLIDGAGDGLTSQERTARKRFTEEAYPVLRDACGSCHTSRAGVEFMKPESGDIADILGVRAALLKWSPAVVNPDAASSSRLVSKGLHDGPGLSLEESTKIIDWIQAEHDAQAHDPIAQAKALATKPFAITVCPNGTATSACPVNHISLDDVAMVAGVALPGAELSFVAYSLTGATYLTAIKFNAGTAGAYIEHPLFVSLPSGAAPIPDQLDRYFATKINAKPAANDLVGGGAEDFIGFAATDMMEIHFKKVAAYTPDTGGGGGGGATGCRALAQFMGTVANQFQTSCGGCHAAAGNNAVGAMSLIGATSTDAATAKKACDDVRTRVNLTTTNSSSIYLAPDPGSATNHPFKFPAAANFTTFKTAVDVWVQAEKTAP